jgi:hypothetical protein
MALQKNSLLDVGLKCASYVMKSPVPLITLARISQNFPVYASLIVEQKVSDDFKKHHQSMEVIYQKLAESGQNLVYLNGLQMDTQHFDFFR